MYLRNFWWKHTSLGFLMLQFRTFGSNYVLMSVYVNQQIFYSCYLTSVILSPPPPPSPCPVSSSPDCEDGGKMRPPSPLLILLYITLSKSVKVVSKRGSGMCPPWFSGSDSEIFACSLSLGLCVQPPPVCLNLIVTSEHHWLVPLL